MRRSILRLMKPTSGDKKIVSTKKPNFSGKQDGAASYIESGKLAMSISSWFCVPEQKMVDLEILCRASCFLVKSKSTVPSAPKYHLVTCSHAVAPWKWPKLYPDEFLTCVNERHTHYTVEIRQENGEFMTQQELIPNVYHHPTRDLAVMHIDFEEKVLKDFFMLGVNGHLNLSTDKKFTIKPDTKVEFHGHELPSAFFDYAVDNRLPFPKTVKGRVLPHTSKHQLFVDTWPVLENGMCGGPVILDNLQGPAASKYERKDITVVGMTEGIVPANLEREVELQGAAVFIEAEDIAEFLDQIEKGLVQPVVGGQIMDVIGADMDPDKVDLKKIVT